MYATTTYKEWCEGICVNFPCMLVRQGRTEATRLFTIAFSYSRIPIRVCYYEFHLYTIEIWRMHIYIGCGQQVVQVQNLYSTSRDCIIEDVAHIFFKHVVIRICISSKFFCVNYLSWWDWICFSQQVFTVDLWQIKRVNALLDNIWDTLWTPTSAIGKRY